MLVEYVATARGKKRERERERERERIINGFFFLPLQNGTIEERQKKNGKEKGLLS